MRSLSEIVRKVDTRDFTIEQVNYIHMPSTGLDRHKETAQSIIEAIGCEYSGEITVHEIEPGIGWYSLDCQTYGPNCPIRFVVFYGAQAAWDAYFARKRGERNETAAVAGNCA